MSFEWLPDYHPGEDLLKASTVFNNWINNYKELQLKEKALNDELATGQLRRAALKLQNESQMQQNQFFQDTKDVRLQGLQTEQQIRQQELRKGTTEATVAEKQLGRFDITATQQDERHKIAMDTAKAQLEAQGVDTDIAKKRLSHEADQWKLTTDQIATQTAETKQRIEAIKSQIKNQAADQEMQNANAAIMMLQGRSPGEQEALKNNIAQIAPNLAPYMKAMPADLSNPNKTMDELMNNIVDRAAKGDKELFDIGSVLATLHVTGGHGVPTMKQEKMVIGGKEYPGPMHAGYDVDETAAKFRKVFGRVPPPAPTGASLLPPPPNPFGGVSTTPPEPIAGGQAGLGSSPTNLALDQFPPELLPTAAHIMKYPQQASVQFDSPVMRNNKGYQEFLRDAPKDIGQADWMTKPMVQGALERESTLANYEKAGLYKETKNSRGQPERQYLFGGSTTRQPLLKDETDRDVFDQLIVHDPQATGKQHLMYMALVRQLANARNKGDDARAHDILAQTYRATGMDFFTPTQFKSLQELGSKYGW